MPRIKYKDHRFSISSLSVVHNANDIIDMYTPQGLNLTLRQLYYQFVARDLFPEDRRWRQLANKSWVRDPDGTKNAEPNYDWLGKILTDARLAGLVDWEVLIDRERQLESNSHWSSPERIIQACSQQFQLNSRATQNVYIEVWIEKKALLGVIEGICTEHDVPYFACKGYTSVTSMWEAANRFIEQEENGKDCVILHLGDHDPSGVDMTRDIQDRLDMFRSTVNVERIALNMDQILELNPPPCPAKITDSRAQSYIDQYGEDSWELDALEPTAMSQLIEEAIIERTNVDARQILLDEQEQHREDLIRVAHNWNHIIETFRGQ